MSGFYTEYCLSYSHIIGSHSPYNGIVDGRELQAFRIVSNGIPFIPTLIELDKLLQRLLEGTDNVHTQTLTQTYSYYYLSIKAEHKNSLK
jgi:hypothetical protein